MDKKKTTSTTTFFGRFCVYENHVLRFFREKIDVVHIRLLGPLNEFLSVFGYLIEN
jgi:hypothetical protein